MCGSFQKESSFFNFSKLIDCFQTGMELFSVLISDGSGKGFLSENFFKMLEFCQGLIKMEIKPFECCFSSSANSSLFSSRNSVRRMGS